MLGKIEGRKRRRVAGDEMLISSSVRHEFEQTPRDNAGQGSLKRSPAMSVSFSGTEAIVAHTGL